MKRIQIHLFTALLLMFAAAPAFAQTSKGTGFYKKGEYKKAISSLEKELKNDVSNAELWNVLGISLEKTGKYEEAQRALEKALSLDSLSSSYRSNLALVFLRLKKYDQVRKQSTQAIELDPQNANAFYIRSSAHTGLDDFRKAMNDVNQAISINEKFAAAYLLESELVFRLFEDDALQKGKFELLQDLRVSIVRLEQCVETCEGDISAIRNAVAENRQILEYTEQKMENATSDNPDSKNVVLDSMKIVSKPKPGYTESARAGSISGSVKLAVMFRSNGTIGPVVVLEGLPDGLTGQAVKAAQGIKFKPEKRNGVAQTVVKTVVFTFTVY